MTASAAAGVAELASFDSITRRLEAGLARQLPGPTAQQRMSPRPRSGWEPGVCPAGTRQAAGLILVYAATDGPRVVLTQRRADLPDHAGQVSLPGGEIESGESHVDAALREAHEEVGLEPGSVSVLGGLTPLHIPISNFVLHPIVATTPERPDLAPADREVARILEPRLSALADPGFHAIEARAQSPVEADVPVFRVDDLIVWGATAMVLAEFLAILDAPPDPWPESTE